MFVKSLRGVYMEIADFFYTEGQVARILGVNRITIWRWIEGGVNSMCNVLAEKF